MSNEASPGIRVQPPHVNTALKIHQIHQMLTNLFSFLHGLSIRQNTKNSSAVAKAAHRLRLRPPCSIRA